MWGGASLGTSGANPALWLEVAPSCAQLGAGTGILEAWTPPRGITLFLK